MQQAVSPLPGEALKNRSGRGPGNRNDATRSTAKAGFPHRSNKLQGIKTTNQTPAAGGRFAVAGMRLAVGALGMITSALDGPFSGK